MWLWTNAENIEVHVDSANIYINFSDMVKFLML